MAMPNDSESPAKTGADPRLIVFSLGTLARLTGVIPF